MLPASRASPVIVRPFVVLVASIAVSRMAATGGTRPERSAGSSADSTVTSRPTMIVRMTVRGSRVSPVEGRSRPRAENAPCRPMASSMPRPRPRIEPTRPTTTDSMSRETVTWRRLAPTARISAFSRWRCATVIENTL